MSRRRYLLESVDFDGNRLMEKKFSTLHGVIRHVKESCCEDGDTGGWTLYEWFNGRYRQCLEGDFQNEFSFCLNQSKDFTQPNWPIGKKREKNEY